jgi:hypothetical protein
MRNGQNKHRMRGRNRSSGGKNHNPLTRVYESNGPDVKIRGTANHVAEKYIQLARDATASGDPVGAENYYQHAEHYFRLIAAAQEQFRQTTPYPRTDGGESRGGDEGYDGDDDQQPSYGSNEPYSPRDQQQFQPREQPYQQNNYQPRENRDNRHDNRQFDNRQENRHENRQEGRQEGRPDNRHQNRQENRNENRHENRSYDRQPPQASAAPDEELGLPSFITGAPPQAAQPNGQEGQDGQGFPLHRRRRRGHRGGRPDMAGGSDQGGDDAQGQPQGD